MKKSDDFHYQSPELLEAFCEKFIDTIKTNDELLDSIVTNNKTTTTKL